MKKSKRSKRTPHPVPIVPCPVVLTAPELEVLRQIYGEVRYADRKGVQLGVTIRADDSDAEVAGEAQKLMAEFIELAKRVGLACSCGDEAEMVGGSCYGCSQGVK